MNKKLHRPGANQRSESLRSGNLFHRLRSSAKLVVVPVLFVMALILSASSPSLAQGNKNSRKKPATTKAQPKRLEGAVISANRVTVKPGYEFEVVRDANTDAVIIVRRKGGAVTIEATCSCVKKTPKGGSSCTVVESPRYISCQPGTGELAVEKGCNQCKWVNVKNKNQAVPSPQ